MSTSTRRGAAADAADGLVGLMDSAVRMGEGLLDAFQGRRTTGLVSALQRAVPRMPMAGRGCGCDIPPPCWMPKELGEVRSHVCAGGTATLRLRVTNCGARRAGSRSEARPDSARGDARRRPAWRSVRWSAASWSRASPSGQGGDRRGA